MSYQIKVVVKDGVPAVDEQTAAAFKGHVPDGTYTVSGHGPAAGADGVESLQISVARADGTYAGTSANWPAQGAAGAEG
jgi:hypothetical protein